jgi:hypothetical protein
MKTMLKLITPVWLTFSILNSQPLTALAQGTAFTYQGQLITGGSAATGLYDFTLVLSNAPSGGSQVGGSVTNQAVGVTNGLFTTTLDFGANIFTGNAIWLALAVRTNDPANLSAFTALTPLQALTPAPYAIFAESANNLAALQVQPNSSGPGASGAPNLIGGASVNYVAAGVVGATIDGGGATSFGGIATSNCVTGSYGTVSGGLGNTAGGQYSTVAGGISNNAAGEYSFATGGFNTASGSGSWVAGVGNVTGSSANDAFLAGGSGNTANGSHVFIAAGSGNFASGNRSFAAGNNASDYGYNHVFVWGDGSANTTAFTNNQFMARASGGVVFQTSSAASPTNSATGTAGVALLPNATAWTTISDRNAKKNFQPVNTKAVLEKLAAIPIQQWNYKWETDGEVPNIGPMAQDFKHAFYPGRDDHGITTLEFDGVELAAIQGLNKKVEAGSRKSEDRIQKLEAENLELKARLEKLEQLLAQKAGGAQ